MDKELHLKLTVRLYTDDNQRCFGPGIATLLERVREHKSLRSAAASMGMAYSKALKLIKQAEKALGFPLTQRSVGGRDGFMSGHNSGTAVIEFKGDESMLGKFVNVKVNSYDGVLSGTAE